MQWVLEWPSRVQGLYTRVGRGPLQIVPQLNGGPSGRYFSMTSIALTIGGDGERGRSTVITRLSAVAAVCESAPVADARLRGLGVGQVPVSSVRREFERLEAGDAN